MNISLQQSALDRVGIGFKSLYLEQLLADAKPVGWLEIHAENFMMAGGPKLAMLDRLQDIYPVSCHGVGLSIGSDEPLDRTHLARLRRLQTWLQPALFSEHLAWSSHGRNYYNDLLPVCYDGNTLERVCDHVDELQQYLGRQILLENPSSYLSYTQSTWHEAEFLSEIAHRTGCGLLLDINNVFVSANNLGFDALDYLDRLPLHAIGEVHLAGHSLSQLDDGPLLIDSHDAPVAHDVWNLFSHMLKRLPPCPVLIERDGSLPPFDRLQAEVMAAADIIAGNFTTDTILEDRALRTWTGCRLAPLDSILSDIDQVDVI